MRTPLRYASVPEPDDLFAVLAKIHARCVVCPSCEQRWLWAGNHASEMWHAIVDHNRVRYNVRKTVLAAATDRHLGEKQVVFTRCDSPACLNPDLLDVQSKGDVVRRQLANGLIHHAAHRTAINRGRREKRATKLDMDKARAIRASDASPQALAEEYGVSRQTIYRVRTHRDWRELTPFIGLGAR